MTTFAALEALKLQLSTLEDAILRPAADVVAPGHLVQLAPDADKLYGGYFLHVRKVYRDELTGSPLVVNGDWITVPASQAAAIGVQRFAAPPRFGFTPARQAVRL